MEPGSFSVPRTMKMTKHIQSCWNDADARGAVARWGGVHGEALALRVYSGRLLGADRRLVLHGGGNVSVKGTVRTLLGDTVEALFIKGSGRDLADLSPGDLPAVDLTHLRRLRRLSVLTDDAMVNEFRTHLFDAGAPTPSIETLVHAFLPHKFVDHSHPDAMLTLTNQSDGERRIREALGDRVSILPYVRPGFDLAKAVAEIIDQQPKVEGIVLLQHGLLTFAEDVRTSYERHIDLVRACENHIHEQTTPRVRMVGGTDPAPNIALAAPLLRGLLADRAGDDARPGVAPIMEARSSEQVLALLSGGDLRRLAEQGPLTGDHLIRTKPWPMLIDNPNWSDPGALREQLCAAVEDFKLRYRRYAESGGMPQHGTDDRPRVVWLPGAGILVWGKGKREAVIAADIAEQTLIAKRAGQAMGGYVSLALSDLHHMEFRGLQQVKLRSADLRPLAGRVVLITGAAGAIGSAIAEVCAEAGATLVITDLDGDRLSPVANRIRETTQAAVLTLRMDVTDESDVRRAFDRTAREFGGVDVVVPNAGVAHVASIEALSAADFSRVMQINATGCLNVIREGARLLKLQGTGGSMVLISSKNVLSPGKEFGAYSASKAAAHQLARLAAVEFAPLGIRVNMLTPDAVFGDVQTPSGLWTQVGPNRSKTHNVATDDLPEFYRRRNLLKARVTGRHVGQAVVFFASAVTPTTGATLPIDGGLPDAFPR